MDIHLSIEKLIDNYHEFISDNGQNEDGVIGRIIANLYEIKITLLPYTNAMIRLKKSKNEEFEKEKEKRLGRAIPYQEVCGNSLNEILDDIASGIKN